MMRDPRSLLSILLIVIITFTPAWAIASQQRVNVTVKGDPLGFTLPEVSSLADVTLTGYDQTTTGTLGTININDARGIGAGWNLVLHADDFVNTDGSGAFIPATGFAIDGTPTVTTVAGNSGPTSFSGLLDGPLLILSAGAGSGMGRYQVDPTISLIIPADTIAGTYETTVTATVTSGP